MQAYNSRGREIVRGRSVRPVSVEMEQLTKDMGRVKLSGNSFLGNVQRMPSRYRTKRSRRRRRRIYRRKVPKGLQPYSIVRKLQTAFQFNMNPAAGNVNVNQLKLNSAVDPSGDIGTGQPLGFDQYALLYQKYCVVKYSVHFKVVSTDNSSPIIVGFTPKRDSSALTHYLHYLECPGTVSRHVTPDIDKVEFGSKGSVKKHILPKGGKLLSDDGAFAQTTSDPNRILYGHVWMQAIKDSADPSELNLVGILYQTIVFFDPIIPSRS